MKTLYVSDRGWDASKPGATVECYDGGTLNS